MQFFCFHLMPWAPLPEDFAEQYDSAWVTCPNSLYDPELGHPLYNRYLDELELADALGFEGVCVNEHHQNAYGNMPSPNIMAACLARRTRQTKLEEPERNDRHSIVRSSALDIHFTADGGEQLDARRIEHPYFVLAGEEGGDADVVERSAADDTMRTELVLAHPTP